MARLSSSSSVGHGEVERFRRFVASRFGLFFDDAKLAFLAEVLQRRLDASLNDTESYLARLECAPSAEETAILAQELTVAETYFFRNVDQFHALARIALPERFRARQGQRTLRILSAGCASGEEPYSIAITARENAPDPAWEISVRGVDLNPSVLERATRARFTPWALRETSAEQMKWFRQEGRDLALDESIRSAVRFERRNLAHDDTELWHPEWYDIIFCRNVMMYFTPEAALRLVRRITAALAPGGYLFLGHAETLRGMPQDLCLRQTHGTFYYQRGEGPELTQVRRVEAAPQRHEHALRGHCSPSTVTQGATSWVDAVQRSSDRIQVLARDPGVPPSAVKPRSKPDLGGAFDLLRRERFSEALEVVRGLLAEASPEPDVLMLEAMLLTHSGQIERAEHACTRLLEIDELSAGAHYVLALCCEANGDLRSAGDHDQVAIYLDPSFAMPRLHLGLLARRAGDFEAARRELSQTLLLLQREDASRLVLFGGGFGREGLSSLCVAELTACGGRT